MCRTGGIGTRTLDYTNPETLWEREEEAPVNNDSYPVCPTKNFKDVLSDEKDDQGGDKHEEAVEKHQSKLTELFRLQLLFDDDPITSRENIIEENINIS